MTRVDPTRLAHILADYREAASRLLHSLKRMETAWDRMHEQEPGWPSGQNGIGPAATQPERLHATLEFDRALADLATLEAEARPILAKVTDVYDVSIRWGTAAKMPAIAKDEPGGDWCRSCWRDNRYCNPVAPRFGGLGLCRWCGDFRQTYKRQPPMEVLTLHHQGRRVTVQQVAVAFKREPIAKKKKRKAG